VVFGFTTRPRKSLRISCGALFGLQVLSEVISSGGGRNSEVACIVLGMAGVDRPEDERKMKEWVAALLPQAQIHVYNDAIAALASGTEGKLFGVVAISGTGMICFGRSASGEECRAGGWGALTDIGSGFQIGISTLRNAWSAHDGTGPPSMLPTLLLQHLKLPAMADVIPWTYSDPSWARIASLAPVAFRAAEEGDVPAMTILREAAHALSVGIITVARKLRLDSAAFPVVLAGSINAQPLMKRLVSELVLQTCPSAQITLPKVDAAVGAALLACTLCSPDLSRPAFSPAHTPSSKL